MSNLVLTQNTPGGVVRRARRAPARRRRAKKSYRKKKVTRNYTMRALANGTYEKVPKSGYMRVYMANQPAVFDKIMKVTAANVKKARLMGAATTASPFGNTDIKMRALQLALDQLVAAEQEARRQRMGA